MKQIRRPFPFSDGPEGRALLRVARHPTALNRPRGFTLIELMLAMIIVALILPTLYGMLGYAFHAKKSAEAAVEPPRSAELSMDLIRADLSQALPPTTEMASSFEGVQGTGTANSDDLIFFSTADSPQHTDANGEIKCIELAVIQANGENVLVRKVVRNLLSVQNANQVPTPTNPLQNPGPDVEVICRGVDGFHLRYFDGSTWDTAWDCTAEDYTLPSAVEVTLSLHRPDPKAANGLRTYTYVRVIPLPCSTAAFDSTVNSGTLQ